MRPPTRSSGADRGTEAKRRSRRVVSRRPAAPPARARHARHPSSSPRLRGAEPAPLPAVEGKIGAPPSTRGGRVAAHMRGRDEGEGHAPSCPQPPRVHPVHCAHPPRCPKDATERVPPTPRFRVFRGDLPPQNSSSVGLGAPWCTTAMPPCSAALNDRSLRATVYGRRVARREGTEAKRRSRRVVSRRPARFLKAV